MKWRLLPIPVIPKENSIVKNPIFSYQNGKVLSFSKRVVFAFSSIVLIPLIVMFIAIFYLQFRQAVTGIQEICNLEVNMNSEKMYENIQSYRLLEKMVHANSDLILFITSPENRDEEEVIRTVTEETHTLERILSVEPNIHAVRIFLDSPIVPERFPVVLHTDRENLTALDPWEYNYVAGYMGTQGSQAVPSVCKTSPMMNGKRLIGYLQVAMRMEKFFPFFDRPEPPYQNDLVLKIVETENGKKLQQILPLSKNNKLTSLTEKDIKLFEKVFFNEKHKQDRLYNLSAGRSVFSMREIPELGIVLAHTCQMSMVYSNLLFMLLLYVVGLIASITCFYFVIKRISHRLFNGVYSLMDGMNEVSSGQLDVQVKLSGAPEVQEAQKTFNTMTKQLVNQIQQIKDEQQLIADTEMKAMQNQINAHFLYNVLETIHMQAVLADNDDVAKSILILGKMLRYCLRWRIHTVTLDEEMEYISAYVSILNIRNDYTITLETDIPESLKDLRIPKMIIQPFVENSFIHGIEPLARDSVIRIYTETDEEHGKIWLCVEDSGCGMGEERLSSVLEYLSQEKYERDSAGSIGVKNIQQRLNMFYGSDYKLEIISEVGKGTLVKVPLPIGGDQRK